MRRGRFRRVLIRHFQEGDEQRRPDDLVEEEPLEIRLDDVQVATTMRTPGDDFELAVGFCFTEGLLADASVLGIRYCGTGSATEAEFNVVTVETDGAPTPTPRLGPTSSACGICGTESVERLLERLSPLAPDRRSCPPPQVLAAIPERVRSRQDLFGTTGAVHAAASFDAAGAPDLVREDIGRHNAVDKVVGRYLLDGRLPVHGMGLFVSGRASFEMVQKAWAAGFSSVVAVSAPSALAVDTARAAGITLAGFARGGHLNVYTPVE